MTPLSRTPQLALYYALVACAAIVFAIGTAGAAPDVIRVAGKAIAIPAPDGMASAASVFAGGRMPPQLDTMRRKSGWELSYIPAELVPVVRAHGMATPDASRLAMITLSGLDNVAVDATNAAHFAASRGRAVSLAAGWRSPYADSIKAACTGSSGASLRTPNPPHRREHLRMLRLDPSAFGWLIMDVDSRHRPTPGAADMVVQGQLLLRGRQIGLLYGHTGIPTCENIAAVERGAREWMQAIVNANR